MPPETPDIALLVDGEMRRWGHDIPDAYHDRTFQEIGIDSLTFSSILFELKDTLNISGTFVDLGTDCTVGSFIDLLQRHAGSRARETVVLPAVVPARPAP